MEPKLPAPGQGHEQTPSFYSEYTPTAPSLERNAERETTLERHDRSVELSERANNLSAPVQTLPLPVSPVPLKDAPIIDNTPLVANDDDLIEQEWVKKAKEIIADTKDDPYRRELEVGRLQVEYLKKRYGKELGAPQ